VQKPTLAPPGAKRPLLVVALAVALGFVLVVRVHQRLAPAHAVAGAHAPRASR